MAIGDSKTLGNTCCAATNGYRNPLQASLEALGYVVTISAKAAGGHTVAMMLPLLPGYFPTGPSKPDFVLISLGTVDLADVRTGVVTEGNWQMGALMDLVHAQYPTAQVRLMRVLRDTFETECNTLAGWITNLVASRSSWAAVGPDERTFLSGHFTDGIHPDSTGYVLTAAEWQANLGH